MAAKSTAYVLDSFAVLAYLEGEAGVGRIRALLMEAGRRALTLHLSLINLGEALSVVEREQGLVTAQRTLAAIDQLPLTLQPVSRSTVLAAARIKARYAIAYADAFAVVVAHEQAAILVTGDPEFKPLVADGILHVEWLPRK